MITSTQLDITIDAWGLYPQTEFSLTFQGKPPDYYWHQDPVIPTSLGYNGWQIGPTVISDDTLIMFTLPGNNNPLPGQPYSISSDFQVPHAPPLNTPVTVYSSSTAPFVIDVWGPGMTAHFAQGSITETQFGVPEPSILGLMGLGLLALACLRKR